MKRKFGTSLFLVFSLMINVAFAQELTIITEDAPPINYLKEGILTGSSVEIVKAILQRLNQPDNIQVLPWARGYSLLKTQPNVVLFSTARTDEREDLFHWVGPLCITRYGFFAKKGSNLKIDSLEDAQRVGAIATYKEDAREQMLKLWGFTNLDSSASVVSGLKKLISGRADLWFSSNLSMPSIAGQIGTDPSDLELVFPVIEARLYIAFSQDTPEDVVEQWRKALNEMKQSGTFEKISRKWLPEDSIPKFSPDTMEEKRNPLELMIYTENSPPGNYLEKGRLTGLSVEVVREILQRLKIPDRIEVVPWARGYTLALTQPNVALFSTTRLPNREKLFKWVGPLYKQIWGFYGKKGSSLRLGSLEDARKVARIGTYNMDAKEQFLQEKGFTNLVSAKYNISNIKHVIEGRLDLWVSSDYNMPYLARQAGVDPDQLELVYAFREVSNYIAFSKQTPDEVVSAWQEALDEIKKEEIFAKISQKYNNVPK